MSSDGTRHRELDIGGRSGEPALQESRHRYEALFGEMLDGVAYCQMLFDEAGQPADWLYLEVNPAFEALTGLRDAAGKRVSQLVPGVRETNPELFEIYGRVAQTGVSEQFETYLPAFERWFSVKVYRPQEGHFAAVFENVTERKRLDEALRERVRRLYDTNIIGTLIARTDGEILEANDYFLGLIGHTCEELERGELSWRALTPREWLPVSDHAIGQMRIHGTSAPYEKEYLRADGTRVPVLVVATSLAGPDELIAAFVLDNTERKRDAGERDRLAAAVEQSTDGVVISDTDLRITYANAAFLASIGRSSADVVGKLMPEVMRDIVDAATIATIDETLAAGHPWRGEIEEQLGDDTRRIEVSIEPTYDLKGDLSSWVRVRRDVTERDRQVRERDRLATVVEQSSDGIVITAPDGHILYANSAFAAELGQRPGDLTGQVLPLIMADRLGAPVVADIDRTIKAGRSWFSEVAMGLPDGTGRQMEISVTPRLDTDGAVSSHLSVFRDVTSLRKAEADRARLASAVEHAADLVIVSDANGIIEYVNPAFERMTGNPAANVLGRSKARALRSYVHSPEFYARLDSAVRRGEPWEGMVTIRRRDGSLFEYEAALSPIRDANGALVGTVEIGRDVTRERALEAAIDHQVRERILIADALADLKAGPTPAATAEAICRQVVGLAGLTTAALYYFSVDGQALPLAFVRADGVPVSLRPLPARRSERLREQAEGGPWVEAWVHRPWHPYARLFRELGVKASAYAPLHQSSGLVGLLIVSSADGNATSQLAEFLPALIEFATVAGALVGPAVIDLTEVGSVRHRMVKTIGEGLFHPVFQPIVDLESREIVGYEALTRFDSGQSPDLCFADAWTVEMGPALELSTLGAAVAAARQLPAGRWLSLNISPRLLADTERLNAVLWQSDRPIVLEITEHGVIEDYEAVQAAMRALGHDVRLAVDDAGAGIANFGHIIELRPNLVKLDIGLVRDVNTDLGRQAMVVGMRHFAAEAGCRLLAEGVETAAEADTLLALGVDLGQGFLFGHPEPVEAWSAAKTSGKPRGRAGERTR